MEQDNFEKNIQRKLDGLKINPPDTVWMNVEKHIGKKHKERKLIFIFLFLIAILLSGAYGIFYSTRNNPHQSHQISELKKDSKPINNEDSSFVKSKKILRNNLKNIDSESVSRGKTKRFKVDSQNKIVERNGKNGRNLNDDFKSKSNKNYSKPGNNEDSQNALNHVNKSFEIKSDFPEIHNANQIDNRTDNIQNQISIDDFSNQLTAEKNSRKLSEKNDSLTKKSFKNQHKNTWNFGFTFSGGSSLIGSNILKRNYPLMDINPNSPLGGISNGGNPSYNYSPSSLKNATGFIAGVLVEKKLSARSKISLGISYKYYSLVNKVGNKIDSVLFASSQYLATNYLNNSANRSHTYRNNFHYLEVPVSIKLQLNKNKKLPLFWNAGINISQLISSNALQFKSNPGIYYNDNSMFNKTQFGLHTGLSVTLFSQQKMPFTFGPYFYYSATSLSDKGLYVGKHFSFIGIRTEIVFRKK